MPSNLALNLSLSGSLTYNGSAGLAPPAAVLQLGQGVWSAMSLALTFGATGNNKINGFWFDQRTVTAGANDNLDFSGGVTNALNETPLFNAIKLILMAIDAPDGTKKLKVGPQGITNAAQLDFGGVGATNYRELINYGEIVNNPFTGYPITAGTADIFGINNPGAGSVTYRILVAGITP
jgi:hypothetical protein